MSRIPFACTIDQIIDHTPAIRELILKVQRPEGFTFKAGQFVMLHVPQDPKPALRAYSLASSSADQKSFQLIFKYVDTGVASRYVWDLKGDETLQFTGPFGKMFFQEPPTQQIVFLNTGSGVSQHMSYLLSHCANYPETALNMFFGVRTREDIYYQKELAALKERFPNFNYQYVLSRPDDTWQGLKGYVQNHIKTLNYLEVPTTFYLCGNGAMIKDVKNRLIEENFDKAHVFAEAFD